MYVKSKWILFFSLLFLFPLLLSHSASAANTPKFSLTSSTDLPLKDKNIIIDIHADQVSDLIAYEFTLAIDPKLWEFVGASSELSGYKATPLQELHAEGIVTFVLTKLGNVAGENGTVKLGQVILKARAPGNDRIQLTGVRLVDSQFVASNYAPDTELAVTITGIATQGSSHNGKSNGKGGDHN